MMRIYGNGCAYKGAWVFVCVRVLGLCVLVYKSVCVFGFIGKVSCLKPFNTGVMGSRMVGAVISTRITFILLLSGTHLRYNY